MLTAAAVLVALLMIAAGLALLRFYGACWGGLLMGGFDLMGKGLCLLIEAVAGALDSK